MLYDLVAFGEPMIRLSPRPGFRLEQVQQLDMYVAGSELNVAACASRLGARTAYVTRLPQTPQGRWVAQRCREQNVDDQWISWAPPTERVGLYFFEYGAAPRSAVAYYDRKQSAFSNTTKEEYPWNQILAQSRYFLTSGITPALGRPAKEAAVVALEAAHAAGCRNILDLNYRSKLWPLREAAAVLQSMLRHVDVLLGTYDDAVNLLDVDDRDPEELAMAIAKKYAIETVVLIYNPDEPNPPLWRSLAYQAGKLHTADQHTALTTVDRIGAGDAFAGGFLHGLLHDDLPRGLAWGNAAMALKNTNMGDLAWVTAEELEEFLRGNYAMVRR